MENKNGDAQVNNEADKESKFAEFVRGLDAEQLARAKATVDQIHGERNPPDISRMGENEFNEYRRKLEKGSQ